MVKIVKQKEYWQKEAEDFECEQKVKHKIVQSCGIIRGINTAYNSLLIEWDNGNFQDHPPYLIKRVVNEKIAKNNPNNTFKRQKKRGNNNG